MSAVTIVTVVVAVVVAGARAAGIRAVVRRRRLQQRFGPEYDRLAGESDSKHNAQTVRAGRGRRVRDLGIRPLTGPARGSCAAQRAGIQEQFAGTAAEAVAASQLLAVAVMCERGYPAEHDDQVLADLPVQHAGTLDRYRAAGKISQGAACGTAATGDLRLAMIDYRALSGDLPAGPAGAPPGPAWTGPAQAIEADNATPGNGGAQVAGSGHPVAAGHPAARRMANGSVNQTEGPGK